MATPISAAPDEPAHMVKAASVVRGQLIGVSSEFGQVVQVPRYIANTHVVTCFAFLPDRSADCGAAPAGDPAEITDGTTTAGLYNPVYYVLVGWPTLLASDDSGIYLMRLASGALSSLFVALAFSMVAAWRRPRIAILGLAVATTPMVVFLNSTVNPNSLEVATILATFTGMLGIVLHPRADLLTTRSMVVLTSAAIAVNSRGLSPIWLALAIFIPLILARPGLLLSLWRSGAVRITIAGVAVASTFAIFWLLRSNSLAAGIDEPSEIFAPPGVGASAATGFLTTLEQTFGLGQAMIGVFGWLDTPAPLAVFFTWSAFVGGLLVLAFAFLRGRALVSAGVLTLAVVLIPPLIQAAYISGGGFIWQGRYTLPAFVCLMVGVGALLDARFPRFLGADLSRLAAIVLGAWALSHAYAFLTALRRYAVGADGTWAELLQSPEWAPPGGVALWTIVLVAALTVTALLSLRVAGAPEGIRGGPPNRTGVRPARRPRSSR